MYTKILEECKDNTCKQQLIYKIWPNKSALWGFPVVYNSSCSPISFDPWSGIWIEENYEDHYCNAIPVLDGNEKRYNKEFIFQRIEEDRSLHSKERYCTALESLTRYGERCDTSLIEIPNIRVVAVLDKVEFGGWNDEQFELFEKRNGYQSIEEWEFNGWTALDYCPFCGVKLPERLDKRIIEVLKDEYSLNSWKDYPKAPPEFHTDEWWKKRGL